MNSCFLPCRLLIDSSQNMINVLFLEKQRFSISSLIIIERRITVHGNPIASTQLVLRKIQIWNLLLVNERVIWSISFFWVPHSLVCFSLLIHPRFCLVFKDLSSRHFRRLLTATQSRVISTLVVCMECLRSFPSLDRKSYLCWDRSRIGGFSWPKEFPWFWELLPMPL